VFSNGPYLVAHDDQNVGILAAPPFFLSSFLQSFNISLGVSAGASVIVGEGEEDGIDLSVSVGIGFAISPFQLPGTVIGPPVSEGHASAQTLTAAIENAIARAVPQAGSSVVPAAPVTTDGNAYFKVQAAPSLDHISSYQLYQAAVDPA